MKANLYIKKYGEFNDKINNISSAISIFSNKNLNKDKNLINFFKKLVKMNIKDFHLVGNNIETINRILDDIIVDNYIKGGMKDSLLGMFKLCYEFKDEKIKQYIFDFLNIAHNDKIKQIYIYVDSELYNNSFLDIISKEINSFKEFYNYDIVFNN